RLRAARAPLAREQSPGGVAERTPRPPGTGGARGDGPEAACAAGCTAAVAAHPLRRDAARRTGMAELRRAARQRAGAVRRSDAGGVLPRSEERRVGKESRYFWCPSV